MATKRKAQNKFKDTKAVKKRDQMRKDDSTSCKKEEGSTKYINWGKKNNENKGETKVMASLKRETFNSECSEDNQNNKRSEFPNLQLNKLIQKKSMLKIQGSISWKIFLFPFFSSERSFSTKKNAIF